MNIESNMGNKSEISKNNYIEVILVSVMMFLPLSSFYNILRLVIALVLFVSLFFKNGISMSIDMKLLSLFSGMILSLLLPRFAVIMLEGNVNSDLWVHEIQRIGFYIILIFVVYHYKISFDFLFLICVITLLFHVAIQTLQLMGVEAVFDFIETYYLEEGDKGIHLSLARTSNIASFRSGSIYMNPNVYMVIPLSILGVILQRCRTKPSILNTILIIVALYSLLLTGSRTTFIVALCMIGYYFIQNEDIGEMKWIIIAVGMVILAAVGGSLAANYRAFNVTDGLSDSIGVKVERIFEYILNSHPIYLITGSLSSDITITMDSEWGHIFAYFGILGIVWYFSFIKLLSRNEAKFPLQVILLRLNFCLVALSASVLLCMPVFSFFCLVSLVEIE